MSAERLSTTEIPYIPFSKNPEKINVHGFNVYNYVSEPEMDKYIEVLSKRNRLADYDAVLVNLWGALELFKDLKEIQGYWRWPEMPKIARVEDGVNEVFPIIDPYLKRKKVLIVEDVYDRGLTMQELFKRVGPESKAVVVAWKVGVRGQVRDKRVDMALKVDNVWLGGKGMDMGFKDEGLIFRQHRGIVVMP